MPSLFICELLPLYLTMDWAIHTLVSEFLIALRFYSQEHCKNILCCQHFLWDYFPVWSTSTRCEFLCWMTDRVLVFWIRPLLNCSKISFIAWAKTEICSLESSRYQEGFERGKEATAWSTFWWWWSVCSFKYTYQCKCMVRCPTLISFELPSKNYIDV